MARHPLPTIPFGPQPLPGRSDLGIQQRRRDDKKEKAGDDE
jgi:hypothetical protein